MAATSRGVRHKAEELGLEVKPSLSGRAGSCRPRLKLPESLPELSQPAEAQAADTLHARMSKCYRDRFFLAIVFSVLRDTWSPHWPTHAISQCLYINCDGLGALNKRQCLAFFVMNTGLCGWRILLPLHQSTPFRVGTAL